MTEAWIALLYGSGVIDDLPLLNYRKSSNHRPGPPGAHGWPNARSGSAG